LDGNPEALGIWASMLLLFGALTHLFSFFLQVCILEKRWHADA